MTCSLALPCLGLPCYVCDTQIEVAARPFPTSTPKKRPKTSPKVPQQYKVPLPQEVRLSKTKTRWFLVEAFIWPRWKTFVHSDNETMGGRLSITSSSCGFFHLSFSLQNVLLVLVVVTHFVFLFAKYRIIVVVFSFVFLFSKWHRLLCTISVSLLVFVCFVFSTCIVYFCIVVVVTQHWLYLSIFWIPQNAVASLIFLSVFLLLYFCILC